MTAAEVARRKAELGLDQPVLIQYFTWLKELLQGNWGYSYVSYRSVQEMVFERVGATLMLTVSAIAISYIIGIPLGLLCAVKPYSPADYMNATAAFIVSGVPGFFLGMILVYIFSIRLKLLPFSGIHSASGSGIIDIVRHLVLPAFAIALPV